jgi:hypothetical protein
MFPLSGKRMELGKFPTPSDHLENSSREVRITKEYHQGEMREYKENKPQKPSLKNGAGAPL